MKLIKILPVLLVMAFIGWSSALQAKTALAVHYTKTNVSCFGQANGKIELSVYGGKMPYVIKWQDGTSATVLENLKSGHQILELKKCQILVMEWDLKHQQV